jgi:hypothetical protein
MPPDQQSSDKSEEDSDEEEKVLAAFDPETGTLHISEDLEDDA